MRTGDRSAPANRSHPQRTEALQGFKNGNSASGRHDIVARGIDIEELGHVVNFDVPLVPADYIHRVGRTARAEATGDAFTFVAPEEEGELRAIERAVGKRLPRVTVPDFDYHAKPEAKLEIPIAERLPTSAPAGEGTRCQKGEGARRQGSRRRRGARPADPRRHVAVAKWRPRWKQSRRSRST